MPALRAAALGDEEIYPSSPDGHPAARGHAVIAGAVGAALVSSP